jgi:hypothetical protein
MGRDEKDDGIVSWYQYTNAEMEEAFHGQQRQVFAKTEAQSVFEHELWRQTRDLWLNVSRASLDFPFAPGFPHARLCYLDEDDATRWGVLIGEQFPAWLSRFAERPETLQTHMWRVHWGPGGRR